MSVLECDINRNITRNCKGAVGGVNERIYIVPYDSIASVVTSPSLPNSQVTELQFNSGAQMFLTYDVKIFTPGFDFAAQGMKGAGSINWQQGIDFTIETLEPEDAEELRKLAFGRFMLVVQARIANTPIGSNVPENKLLLIGGSAGLTLETNTGGTGKVETDTVGFMFRLSGAQTTPVQVVTPNPDVYDEFPQAPNRSFLSAIVA